MAFEVCHNVIMKRQKRSRTLPRHIIIVVCLSIATVSGIAAYVAVRLFTQSAVTVTRPHAVVSSVTTEKQQVTPQQESVSTKDTEERADSSSTSGPQDSTTPVASQPQAQVDSSPASSIVLTRVSQRGFLFTTANFSSPSYLKVIEPVATSHPQETIINTYGVTVGPAYGTYPRQQGGATLELPVGIETGDTYRMYVCANVGGSCGLRSNSLTGVAMSDSFGVYINFN